MTSWACNARPVAWLSVRQKTPSGSQPPRGFVRLILHIVFLKKLGLNFFLSHKIYLETLKYFITFFFMYNLDISDTLIPQADPPWYRRHHALICCNKQTQGSKNMRVSTWEIWKWANKTFESECMRNSYQVINISTYQSWILHSPDPFPPLIIIQRYQIIILSAPFLIKVQWRHVFWHSQTVLVVPPFSLGLN
jgi:hypothetical protein